MTRDRQSFSKILFDTPDTDTITIEEFVQGFDSKCAEIEATLAVLSQLTFSTQLPLSELATLLQLLHTIENQRRSVERQAAKLGLMQAAEQIVQGVERLKSTREFAETIAASNLPAPVKCWLYQEHAKSRVAKGSSCVPCRSDVGCGSSRRKSGTGCEIGLATVGSVC